MISQQDILTSIKALPTLPSAFHRLTALARDENASARDFEAAIKPDPALTANILRLANSALYGYSREISTVQQAITILGIKKVLELSISAAFARVIPGDLPGYGIDANQFWQHSIATAVLADSLAGKHYRQAKGLSFTCGLLHDIGKFVTRVLLAEGRAEVLQRLHESNCAFVQAEAEVLGMDHAEIGATVASFWQLPEAVCLVARWHHQPDCSDSHQILVDMVHIADCLSHAFGYGADVGELARDIVPGAMERLGFSTGFLEQTVCLAFNSIKAYCEPLGANSGGR